MCWCFCMGESQSSHTIWALQLEIVRTDNSQAFSQLSVLESYLSDPEKLCYLHTYFPLFLVRYFVSKTDKAVVTPSGTSKASPVPCLSLSPSCTLPAWRSELCSSLGSISPGVLARGKQPVLGRSPGLLAGPIESCHFWSFLCALQAQGTHKSAFHPPLSKKHSGETFGRQKVLVVNMCPTWENIPWYHTPFIFLPCAVGTDLHFASSHSSRNRNCLACVSSATLCGSVDILFQTGRDFFPSWNAFFKQKNAWACSLLHM